MESGLQNAPGFVLNALGRRRGPRGRIRPRGPRGPLGPLRAGWATWEEQAHNRMKHVQWRHLFVRDMVESFEIEVLFVRTHDNIADFFTKSMKSVPQFFRFRAIIMNEPSRAVDGSGAK